MSPLIRSFLRLLTATSMILGVASCTEKIDTPPIASATGYRYGRPVSLNQQQLLVLSHWIDMHRTGWKGLMQTPPDPSIGITVKYADGRSGSFEIWHDSSGGGGVVYHYVYDPTPGAKQVDPLEQRLSEQDVQAFRAIAYSTGK